MNWSTNQQAIFSRFAELKCGKPNSAVVLARAGSGKTTTIVEALQHITDNRQSFLLTTFLREGMKDLKRKVDVSYRGKARVDVRTLHSLGYGFMRQHWGGQLRKGNALSDWRGWNLAQEVLPHGTSKHIKGLVARLNSKGRELNVFATPEQLEGYGLRFNILPTVSDEQDGFDLATLAKYARDAITLSTQGPSKGQIDFADMVCQAIANEWMRPEYNCIVVDEYQDMSPMQLALCQGSFKDSIIVVGDDRQGIYGFRGADTEFAMRIQRELNADLFSLNVSYRCPKSVVELAANLVPDFEAFKDNVEGEIISFTDDAVYNETVKRVSPGDVVLTRYNAPAVPFVLKCLREGKPACVKGRKDEVERFKKLVKELTVGCDTLDAIETASGVDEVTQFLSNLTVWYHREVDRIYTSNVYDPAPLVDAVDDRFATIRALADMATSVQQISDRLDGIFKQISAHACVTVSTIHKFKGQEADTVFVLCDTLRVGSDLEEDNIGYVGVTRTRHKLYLVNGSEETFRMEVAA